MIRISKFETFSKKGSLYLDTNCSVIYPVNKKWNSISKIEEIIESFDSFSK